MTFTYQHNDEIYAIDLDTFSDGQYRARLGDRELMFEAVQLANGAWLLTVDGQRMTVHIASDDTRRYVQIDGKQFTLNKIDPRSRRPRATASAAESQLTAQMPGQVIEISVHDGESVASGQPLMVLEAMKMEIRVTAPRDGMVKRVLVAEGDFVDREQLLIELDEPQAEG